MRRLLTHVANLRIVFVMRRRLQTFRLHANRANADRIARYASGHPLIQVAIDIMMAVHGYIADNRHYNVQVLTALGARMHIAKRAVMVTIVNLGRHNVSGKLSSISPLSEHHRIRRVAHNKMMRVNTVTKLIIHIKDDNPMRRMLLIRVVPMNFQDPDRTNSQGLENGIGNTQFTPISRIVQLPRS